jgi:hypothetical protein
VTFDLCGSLQTAASPRPAALIDDDEVAGNRLLCWTGKTSGLKHIVKDNPTT